MFGTYKANTTINQNEKNRPSAKIYSVAEGLYLFENDDIGYHFEVRLKPKELFESITVLQILNSRTVMNYFCS